ncbi:MAG: hypothetical protein WAK54_10615 [Bradyrhizobium sp.]|jgi:hypothetical protein
MGARRPALARQRDFAYLKVMAQQVTSQPEILPQSRSSGGIGSAIAWAITWTMAGLGSIVLLGALALWFHYGSAVFFEMVASGVSACF